MNLSDLGPSPTAPLHGWSTPSGGVGSFMVVAKHNLPFCAAGPLLQVAMQLWSSPGANKSVSGVEGWGFGGRNKEGKGRNG